MRLARSLAGALNSPAVEQEHPAPLPVSASSTVEEGIVASVEKKIRERAYQLWIGKGSRTAVPIIIGKRRRALSKRRRPDLCAESDAAGRASARGLWPGSDGGVPSKDQAQAGTRKVRFLSPER